jgi:hypothetical protein
MTELLQGFLDQFASVLDISKVQPIFGVKGLFWIFLLIEICVRLYMGRASRQLREVEPEHRQNLVRRYWFKVSALFLFIRPFCIVSSPESGRFNALMLNELINLILVVGALLRLHYAMSEDARFEEWTDLDAAEVVVSEDRT